MPGSLVLPISTLYGFLLVLTRMAGVFVFVPLPGVKSGPEMARAVFAIGFTLALFPRWPEVHASQPEIGQLLGWIFSEAALGIGIGLAVAFVTEAFLLAAQVIGLQAGYAYASMIDPATQADSSVLLVFAQLASGLLFFALGLDREIIRIFAWTLDAYPPGHFALSPRAAPAMVKLGAGMFSVGLRLALPVLALLVLVDLALALLGRLNAQLQLLTLAFPAKMLAALGLLACIAVLFPRVYQGYALQALGAVRGMLARTAGGF